MFNVNEELEKVSLTEALVESGFSEALAESVVDGLYNPSEPAYICNTPEELTAAIDAMSEGDSE